jgi:hypothetical protein
MQPPVEGKQTADNQRDRRCNIRQAFDGNIVRFDKVEGIHA